MMSRNFACLSLLAVALGAPAAHADIVATFVNVSPGQNVEFTINSGTNWTGTQAGRYNWQGDISNDLGLNGAFGAFCIDLTQFISGGTSYTFQPLPGVVGASLPGNPDLGTPIDGARELQLSELWGRFYNGLTSNEDFAAFQIAVWEIVYDAGLDVYSGFAQFRNNADAIDAADKMLKEIDGTGPMINVFALSTPTAQDMLVPTPGAAALLGLGTLALGRRRR